jgi:hypothetical protein
MSFQTRLTNLETSFYLTLEGYKKAFIRNAREDTDESKNFLEQAKGRLNKIFSNLIQLRADITNQIGVNKNNIVSGNKQITTAETSWRSAKKQLDNEYGVNLAAKPLKHDTNIEKNSSYLTSLCYILGIIMIIILIIKQFKAAQIPVARAVAIPRVRGIAV